MVLLQANQNAWKLAWATKCWTPKSPRSPHATPWAFRHSQGPQQPRILALRLTTENYVKRTKSKFVEEHLQRDHAGQIDPGLTSPHLKATPRATWSRGVGLWGVFWGLW